MPHMLYCPHCGAEYQPGQRFCESCGKAVPAGNTHGGPRVIEYAARSGAGFEMLEDELRKQQKKASTALIIVAVLQTLAVVLFYFIIENAPPEAGLTHLSTGLIALIALAFWGLWFWSRSAPMPAAITGLVLYLSLQLLDAVVDPSSLARGWLVKIIVIVLLARAIEAGVKYRKLLADARERGMTPA